MAKLDDILKEMSEEVAGYVTSAVVGMDGINVASHAIQQAVDTESITAQMTSLFKQVDGSIMKLGIGEIEENLIDTEYVHVLMRFLPGKQYFLVLVTYRKTGKLGNMRMVSKSIVDRISKSIPR